MVHLYFLPKSEGRIRILCELNRFFIPLAMVSFLIFLSQCDQSSTDSSRIIMPARGSWFFRGDNISLISEYRVKRTGHETIVCVLTQKEKQIFRSEYYYDELITLPIPETAENGALTVTCYPSEKPEKGNSVQVYYMNEKYGESDISYFPPMPMAGSIVEAACRLENPVGDPYVRWRLQDRILAEGYFSDGMDRFCFYGPRNKGNYTLSAEVFPSASLSEQDIPPQSCEVQIFFDETPDGEGLLDPDKWNNLFFCDGTHIDRGRGEGVAESGGALTFISAQDLAPLSLDGDRAYGFGPSSRLSFDGKILQGQGSVNSRTAALLMLDRPEEEEEPQAVQIFDTRDGTGDYSFTLFRRGDNFLLSFQVGTDRYLRSSLPFERDLYGRPFWLVVEVYQKEENLLIRWYLDGILEKEEQFADTLLPAEYQGGGRTVWGSDGKGYNSFEGVLLEWGFSRFPSEIPGNGQG